MKNTHLKSNLFSIIAIVLVIFSALDISVSCGRGKNESSNNGYSSSRDSDLSEYVGTWELFQQGNGIGESASFRMKIRSNGNVEVKHWASGFGHEEILDEGSGKCRLIGSTLVVELTSGRSRGTIYEFDAKRGVLYINGQRLSKSNY